MSKAQLIAEVRRCHKRLEIDHYWRMKGNGSVRVNVPWPARRKMIDGISCRDESIRIMDKRIDRLSGKRGATAEKE